MKMNKPKTCLTQFLHVIISGQRCPYNHRELLRVDCKKDILLGKALVSYLTHSMFRKYKRIFLDPGGIFPISQSRVGFETTGFSLVDSSNAEAAYEGSGSGLSLKPQLRFINL